MKFSTTALVSIFMAASVIASPIAQANADANAAADANADAQPKLMWHRWIRGQAMY